MPKKKSSPSESPQDSDTCLDPDIGPPCPVQPRRKRQNPERVAMLARPTARRLRCLWDERCEILEPRRRDNIKSALEEDYFMTPEQTEEYFRALRASRAQERRRDAYVSSRKEQERRTREMNQRQKWLVCFSAQVAYRLCDYVARGQKELLVSNRLRSIADVVLERVAEILGEPKPSRACGGRLARFMVAVSDRIAVWIESAVYRAAALEPQDDKSEVRFHLDASAAAPAAAAAAT